MCALQGNRRNRQAIDYLNNREPAGTLTECQLILNTKMFI